ncbi:MAG: DUF3137 domain-containing protein [Pseudomonadota bacterium]
MFDWLQHWIITSAARIGGQFRNADNPGGPSFDTLKRLHPELRVADTVWTQELHPRLERFEAERAQAIAAAALGGVIMVGAFFLAPFLARAILPGGLGILFVYGALFGSVYLFVFRPMEAAWQASFKAKRLIVPVACALFGLEHETVTETDDILDRLKLKFGRTTRHQKQFSDGDLVPEHRRRFPELADAFNQLDRYGLLERRSFAEFEDRIHGTRAGATFESIECRLTHVTQSSKHRNVDVNYAHIIQMNSLKTFLGTTVLRRGKFLARRPSGTLEPVKLESTAFDEQFEAFSSDQVEARFLLTPDVMDALTLLSRKYHSESLAIVFQFNRITLRLDAPNRFESGSLFCPIDEKDRFTSAAADLAVLMDVIDAVAVREWTNTQRSQIA